MSDKYTSPQDIRVPLRINTNATNILSALLLHSDTRKRCIRNCDILVHLLRSIIVRLRLLIKVRHTGMPDQSTRKQESHALSQTKRTALKCLPALTVLPYTQTRRTENCDILAPSLTSSTVLEHLRTEEMLGFTQNYTWESNIHVLLQKTLGVTWFSRPKCKPTTMQNCIL